MRRVRLTLALAAGSLLATTAASLAAIDNSHHDATRYISATAESKCSYCHGLPWTAPTTTEATNFGAVGAMCVARCHTTAGLFGSNTEAVPRSAAVLDSTGAYRAALLGSNYVSSVVGASHPVASDAGRGPTITVPDQTSAMTGTTWPYTNATYLAGGTAAIQCTSCHSVHDNARAPFVWAPLGTQTTPAAANAAASFCERCHDRRADVTGDLATQTLFGNHPVEIAWNPATAAARGTGLADNAHGRRPRALAMATYGANRVFDVGYTSLGTNDLTDPTNHYVVGGHTGDMLGNGVSNGDMVGCYSCHSAHPGTDTNLLLLGPQKSSNANTSPLCGGCHGTAGNRENPGNTAYYHPVNASAVATSGQGTTTMNFVSSVGGFRVTVDIPLTDAKGNTPPTAVPLGNSNNGTLICSSCHDIHNGQGVTAGVSATTAYMCIRPLVAGQTKMCASCHTGKEQWGGAATQTAAAANMHHLTFNTTIPNNGSYSAEPTWAATFGVGFRTSGTFGGTNLDCADCHVFNGTAHNW